MGGCGGGGAINIKARTSSWAAQGSMCLGPSEAGAPSSKSTPAAACHRAGTACANLDSQPRLALKNWKTRFPNKVLLEESQVGMLPLVLTVLVNRGIIVPPMIILIKETVSIRGNIPRGFRV